MNKKLYRKPEGQMICGVCTGLAEYFDQDVTLIRLIAVVTGLFSGAGILAYIIAAIIMPVGNPNNNGYTNVYPGEQEKSYENNDYNNNNYPHN